MKCCHCGRASLNSDHGRAQTNGGNEVIYRDDNERRSWSTDKIPDELPLSTIFQLYRGSRFIGGGAENHRPEKIHTGTNIQVDYTWRTSYVSANIKGLTSVFIKKK